MKRIYRLWLVRSTGNDTRANFAQDWLTGHRFRLAGITENLTDDVKVHIKHKRKRKGAYLTLKIQYKE
jgi:hypothetical protein